VCIDRSVVLIVRLGVNYLRTNRNLMAFVRAIAHITTNDLVMDNIRSACRPTITRRRFWNLTLRDGISKSLTLFSPLSFSLPLPDLAGKPDISGTMRMAREFVRPEAPPTPFAALCAKASKRIRHSTTLRRLIIPQRTVNRLAVVSPWTWISSVDR
jgi:hypothetical protein